MGTCFCQIGGYKEHFACFRCRKMHRKQAYRELSIYSRPATYDDYQANCPECGERMQNMGREFQPPKQGQLKQWRELEHEYWQRCREAALRRHRYKICASKKVV